MIERNPEIEALFHGYNFYEYFALLSSEIIIKVGYYADILAPDNELLTDSEFVHYHEVV